jgi:hypothetical protein
MASTMHGATPIAISLPRSRPAAVCDAPWLRLLPSGEGWSLVRPNGGLVFQALGTGGRRECLEFARAHGVVALLS